MSGLPGREDERGLVARLTRKSLDGFHHAGRSALWRRVLRIVVPVVLLAAALVALGGQDELKIPELIAQAARAPWHISALLVLTCAGTVLATSALLWILIQRYGRVGFWEMACLTQSSALLNYLPMRPGMVGRVGYHKLVNRVTVRDSIKVLLWANALVIVASALLLALCVALSWFLRGDSAWFAVLAVLPIAGFAAFGRYAELAKPEADPHVFRLLYGMAVRLIELHLWAARFWAAFAIVGVEIGWGGALALAAAHTVALMIPISGNGLGVSEWFLGFGLMVMPATLSVAVVGSMEVGLAAGLIARGFEMLTLVPLGLIGGWFVRRRLMEARRESPGETAEASVEA